MHARIPASIPLSIASLFAAVLLVACGGGGSSSSGGSTSTSLSGVASKGPLDGAHVCAYALVNGVRGTQVGNCVFTDAQGGYRLDLGGYAGDVLIEASGGSYTDEASGQGVDLAEPLRAVVIGVTSGETGVAVTALTEIATRLAESQGGLQRERVTAALERVQAEFGVADILHTQPADALQNAGAADAARRAYGLALAGVAQYQQDQGGGNLGTSLDRVRDCLADASRCGLTRMHLNWSRQIFEQSRESASAAAPAGASVCMIRAAENTASACLLGLDPATQRCDAASLGTLVGARFVEYFRGELSYTPARRCDADSHAYWDVASNSFAGEGMVLYSAAAYGVVFVDNQVAARSTGDGGQALTASPAIFLTSQSSLAALNPLTVTGNASLSTGSNTLTGSSNSLQLTSANMATILATGNVDVYGQIRFDSLYLPDVSLAGHVGNFRVTRSGSDLANQARGIFTPAVTGGTTTGLTGTSVGLASSNSGNVTLGGSSGVTANLVGSTNPATTTTIVDFRGDLIVSSASSSLGQTGATVGGYPPITVLTGITQRP